MGKTTFSTNSAETKKAWEEKLFREMKKELYWEKFMGGMDKPVYVKEDLSRDKGDTITFTLVNRLTGTGVTDGQILEGNEEKLQTYTHTVSLQERAHAVRDSGRMSRQRVLFSIDEESKTALRTWGAEKIDKLMFDALAASPTTYFSLQSGTRTKGTTDPSASIEATDLITPKLLSHAKTWCLTGGNRSQPPLIPIMVDGKRHLVYITHPDALFDLKNDSTYTQAAREAEVRGKNNPLFTGAVGVWDGVIVHEHENIPITTTWGAGGAVAGVKGTMFGASALCWAWGMRPVMVQSFFDFEREHGYAFDFIYGVNKPKFNSLDYGSVAVWTARTRISDAA